MPEFNDRRPQKRHVPLGKPGEKGSSIRGVVAQGFQHVVSQTPSAAAAATDPAKLAQHIFDDHYNHGVTVRFRKDGSAYPFRMSVDTAAAKHDQWHRDNKDHAADHTH